MKPPREILSRRHQSAEPRLDAIRREVIAEHVIAPRFQSEPDETNIDSRSFAQKLWEELVLPCRRVWVGVAAAWIVILMINRVSSGSEPQMAVVKALPRNPEVMAALEEQALLRHQLLEPVAPAANIPTQPGPRSEREREAVVV